MAVGCDPIPAPQNGTIATLWSRPLAGAFDVALDGAGDILVAGSTEQPADLGSGVVVDGPQFVAKLSPAGDALWGVSSAESHAGLVADATGAYRALAGFSTQGPLVGWDAAGQKLWQRSFDLSHTIKIVTAGVGETIIAGTLSHPPLDYGTGSLPTATGASTDTAMIKLDASGQVIWARALSDAVWPVPPSDPAPAGAVHALYSVDLAPTPDGGAFALVELVTAGIPPYADHGVALIRVGPSGDTVWVRRFPHIPSNLHPHVTAGATGTTVVDVRLLEATKTLDLGCGEGVDPQVFGLGLAVTGFDGTPRWTRWLTVNSSLRAAGIDADDNVWVAGGGAYTEGLPFDVGGGTLFAPDAQPGLVVARYGPNGAHLASKVVATITGNTDFGRFAVDPEGRLIATGFYQGTLDLGAGPLPEVTDYGSFVARLGL